MNPRGRRQVQLISEVAIQEADDAFGKMVSGQLARITGELHRLDQVLKAGRVDARILAQFRGVVDQVRTCGWHVQLWLEGNERALSEQLMEEQVGRTTRQVKGLASELKLTEQRTPGAIALKEAVRKLDEVL